MDDNAVSPTLVDSCLRTWSGKEAQVLAASLCGMYEAKIEGKSEVAQAFEEKEDKSEVNTGPTTQMERLDQPSFTTPYRPPSSTGVELSSCGFHCRQYSHNNHINQIAMSRAKDSFTRQRESIFWEAAQSIQKDGTKIQSWASEQAAQKLRMLATHVNDDESPNSSGAGSLLSA